MSAGRMGSATKRLRSIVFAWPLLLLAVCSISIAQTALKTTRAPAATALVSRPATAATQLPPARSGAEVGMIELQSTVSQRATAVQAAAGMTSSINQSNKAVAGNISGGGTAPACKKCVAKAKGP